MKPIRRTLPLVFLYCALYIGVVVANVGLAPVISHTDVFPLPTVDLSGPAEAATHHVVVARGTTEIYQGHPTTVLLPDGKTIYCVWTINHGGPCGPMKRSDDGGLTWSDLLPVPDNWKTTSNCPSIYRFVDPHGKARLVVFAQEKGVMRRAYSEDDGKTWSPMQPAGTDIVPSVMPFTDVKPVDGGKRLLAMTNIRRPGETKAKRSNILAQSFSTDGGLTWSALEIVRDIPGLRLCEPEIVRSPDGKQLLCLIREDAKHESLFMTSDDEGRTWSKEKTLPKALWGDRHKAKYTSDGRLVVVFRDVGRKTSPTNNHFVAWVGTYDDIVNVREAGYRVKLIHNHRRGKNFSGRLMDDCGYPGLEVLPDGTLVATTYAKYTEGDEGNYVVAVRFKLSETDATLRTYLPQKQTAQNGRSTGSIIPNVVETRVEFNTSDPFLRDLYAAAIKTSEANEKDYSGRPVLIEGGGYNGIWIETQPMGGEMNAKRNMTTAFNNTLLFIEHQLPNGRYPGLIRYRGGKMLPVYTHTQGYCFPFHALNLYYWNQKRDDTYLRRLYDSMEKFDAYLWRYRDSDGDGCLESWSVWDTGEDNSNRFAGTKLNRDGWAGEAPPDDPVFPIESMDFMAYSYDARATLARLSALLGNGKEKEWQDKAAAVSNKLREYLWDDKRGACFDRDRDNKTMPALIHNNLRAMYHGIFTPEMAGRFVREHLLNPKEFWTPFPLPSVAINDPVYRVGPNDWSGESMGLTYQRAIRALENYGFNAELVLIGKKLIAATGRDKFFTQQYDPRTGAASPYKDRKDYGPTLLATLEYMTRFYGVSPSSSVGR